MTGSETPLSAQENLTPKRIGGWLFLPLYLLIVSMFSLAYFAVATRFQHRVMAVRFRYIALHPGVHETDGRDALALLDWMTLGMIATLLFGLFCLVQFLRKNRTTPRLMIFWYCANIALNAVLVIQIMITPAIYRNIILPDGGFGQQMLELAGMSIVSAILIAYFKTSVRVKNTFVR